MAMAEESSIERKFTQAVKKKGGLAIKMTPVGLRGLPDRIVLIQGGRAEFVELKAPGQKPRPLQLKWMERLRRMGFACYKCDSRSEVERIVDEIFGA